MILAAVPDLMFRSRIGEVAKHLKIEIRFQRDPQALVAEATTPSMIVIDLDADLISPVETIAAIRKNNPTIKILGFLSHVHIERKELALAAGCTVVYSRGEFTKRLPELLVE